MVWVLPHKTLEEKYKGVESIFKEVIKGWELDWTRRDVMQSGDSWKGRKFWGRPCQWIWGWNNFKDFRTIALPEQMTWKCRRRLLESLRLEIKVLQWESFWYRIWPWEWIAEVVEEKGIGSEESRH